MDAPGVALTAMPHVKGNKFKPKAPVEQEANGGLAPAAGPAVAAAAAARVQPASNAARVARAAKKQQRRELKEKQKGQAMEQQQAKMQQPDGQQQPGKKKRKRKHSAGAEQQGSGAKQLQQGQGQPPSKQARKVAAPGRPSVIPTVVGPPPKVGQPSVAAATSNWAALQAALHAGKQQRQQQQRGHDGRKPSATAHGSSSAGAAGAVESAVPGRRPAALGSAAGPTRVLGLDCEMVGTGPGGQVSILAR